MFLLCRPTCVFSFVTAQSFNEAPSDVSGIKGQTVTIKCSINNRQGDVQWVFDGFALGFDRDLTGYPRYHVTGNEEGGEYHLLIENLQLSDDGEFSCQVLPSNTDPGSGLVGKAYLTVQGINIYILGIHAYL